MRTLLLSDACLVVRTDMKKSRALSRYLSVSMLTVSMTSFTLGDRRSDV